MINILLNSYQIDEDWCYDYLCNVISAKNRITIIPFSFRDSQVKSAEDWNQLYDPMQGKYYSSIVNPLKRYGILDNQLNWINYFLDNKETAKRKIEKSDILYLTGGLPDRTMDRLREFDLVETVKKFHGILLGFSAGAMIQCSEYHITPDKDYSNFSYQKGLQLNLQFDIEVHYEATDIQDDSIWRVVREKRNTSLCDI